MGLFNKKDSTTRLYESDKAVRDYCSDKKSRDLTEKEHKELNHLLSDRADAMSDVLGQKVYSISYKDAKAFRERNKKS